MGLVYLCAVSHGGMHVLSEVVWCYLGESVCGQAKLVVVLN